MRYPLKTLNGRFVWVNLIFLILLFGLTLYAHHSVQRSAGESLKYVRDNQMLSEKLNSIINLLESTESKLHQYSSFLRIDLHDDILQTLSRLEQQTEALQRDAALQPSANLRHASQRLERQTKSLSKIIKQYLHIMQDVKSRYPGMPILLTKLEPTNREFSEAVEQALQEGELTSYNPNVIKRDQYQIMQLFQEARYSWSMQVSWFRVFVANRMGAFGDPKTTMKNNLKNRQMFVENVARTLRRLDKLNAKGMLGLQQEISLQQMQQALNNYNEFLKQAVKIYSSADWRADVALMRDMIQPAMNDYWRTLHNMEIGLTALNNQGLSRTQATANLLSYFIWIFAGVISLMVIIAYKVFQKKIQQPLLQLAGRMQADEMDGQRLLKRDDNVEEINRLVDAYNGMRAQVDNRQQRLQSILDNAAESIITIDDAGCVESFNKAASRLFQYEADEVIGREFTLLFAEDESHESGTDPATLVSTCMEDVHDSAEREMIGRRKDGSEFYLVLKFSEMQIAGRPLYTAIVEDISERRAVLEHLRHLAEHDSLTGLYNRQYFNEEMGRIFDLARRRQDFRCACVYIDLDNFKYVNDTLGHLEGDRLLVGIAQALRTKTRKTDVLARLGGDEFALILHDVDKEQATAAAENFRHAIAEYSFIAGGKIIDSGCSIGVALHEFDIDTKEGLLARADVACHMAKRNGRNRVYIFEHEDKNRIDCYNEEMGWARRIRYALEQDDFVFACQPMIQVRDGTVYSQELLLRMRDPDTGQYLLPGAFMQAAERFGLMPEIDRWVIEHAFLWLNSQWENMPPEMCYFINLSGQSIGDINQLEFIKQLLPSLQINPEHIIFEITEDVAISNLEHAEHFLHELHLLGFRTALDDFGVGYSSFSYLRELDVDFVKIDGSFISCMHTDELSLALVKAINQICHILGKKTVAEFVQHDVALKLLKQIGVDYAQGYNIADAAYCAQNTIQFRYA